MERVAEGLTKLEKDGINLESLRDNEQFVSIVLHATQIALRTHQEAKLQALRNAILNVAQGKAPDEALQFIFLNLVDAFTEWHVRILKYFQSPPAQPNILSGALSDVIERAFPELRGRRDFYRLVWNDLYQSGLVNTRTDSLDTTMTAHGLSQKRTTNLGDQFLAFLS